ncbi:c-type cytochrome [Antarctobacter heliothermus]|uniref:Cytochrome c domain-containing protein n=1 Tax=Antarctobacter heliothermus TaxID=74033 RepID=A0A239FBS3_9RHOB|nr:c-type cytochrome [Antarctobacter heliothermus]SNS53612.1 hypothetical protein SAMN04488078_101919 [Antarctobacter heliothermus]
MSPGVAYTIRGLALCLSIVPMPLAAQENRPVRLHAPPALVDSGLIKHILPRFTLKTRVRVDLVDDPAAADIALGDTGVPLFAGLDAIWHLQVQGDHAGTARFADWLGSEVGANTVASFAPDGAALFGPPPDAADVAVVVTYEGDAKLGHKVSRAKCTRCHVIDEATRGFGIDSTPSFMVLRTLSDWDERFYAFYTLNPHPAFTVVEGLTLPFPKNRPSPIAPVELTVEEVDAIVAYVAALQAADLGAPLIHQ